MTYWVVVEWNQASGQPRIVDDGELYWTVAEAQSCALGYEEELLVSGRRERYTVHEIDLSNA